MEESEAWWVEELGNEDFGGEGGIAVVIAFWEADFVSEVKDEVSFHFEKVSRGSRELRGLEDSIVSCEFFEGEEVHGGYGWGGKV